jgi:hypothetical protein
MKSKILLITISAALVVTLAVGGTLMLFTSQSAVATNVVTLGDMKVVFKEGAHAIDKDNPPEALPTTTPSEDYLLTPGKSTQDQDYDFASPAGSIYKFEGEDETFSGIVYTNKIVPNSMISKVPVIEYSGVPGYLRVKADITITQGEAPVETLPEGLTTLLAKIYSNGNGLQGLHEDFYPVPADATGLSFYFYYAPLDDEAPVLTPMTPTGDDPIVLFYGLKIENYTDENDLNAFADLNGYSINLDLHVQAVQADWNNPVTTGENPAPASESTIADWPLFFQQLDGE